MNTANTNNKPPSKRRRARINSKEQNYKNKDKDVFHRFTQLMAKISSNHLQLLSKSFQFIGNGIIKFNKWLINSITNM